MRQRTLSLPFLFVSLLSGSRVPLGALLVFFALDPNPRLQRLSLLVIIALFTTDFLDGPLARCWKVTTELGFVLDGLGDRAAYLACLLIMSERLGLPYILTFLFVMRDFMLYAVRSLNPAWKYQVRATRLVARLHAGSLRVLLVLYLLPFYSSLFARPIPVSPGVLKATLLGLAICATLISYLGLIWNLGHVQPIIENLSSDTEE